MPSPRPELQGLADTLDGRAARALYYEWPIWAREAQLPPQGDWTTWLLLGGRGAGKTRAGAEWVRGLAAAGVSPIAIVGETMVEAVAVMLDGESGLLRTSPTEERPRLRGNALLWSNGVVGTVLGAADPERFRGPQFAAAWCDEVAKWPQAEAAWDMLQFGLRLGDRPRQLATTTPRPTKLLKRLLADPQTVVTRMTTQENRRHLADAFLGAVVGRYRGSVLGRQELDGELIEDLPGALWTRDMFRPPGGEELGRIVVAVDPPVTGGPRADACGIVVAARAGEGAVVLEDRTLKPAPPLSWARRAVAAYRAHGADAIVAEVNQGGDLVKAVIAQIDPTVPVRAVRANRGKWLRAEPVAALYGRGLVAHRPRLTALEDEMCGFGGDGQSGGHSPDRVDALVWALTELLLNEVVPRIRGTWATKDMTMPNWWNRLTGGGSRAPAERKSAQSLLALTALGDPNWSRRSYPSLATEGFARNPVVYRCVRMIAEAANRVPLAVEAGGRRLADHPLRQLLAQPNPRQSGGELLEALYCYLQTAGNAYLEATVVEGEVIGLFGLRPDRMQVVAGRDGWPAAYDYTAEGRTVRLSQAAAPLPRVLHLTLFHPLDDNHGLAPLEAAQQSLDIHNAASRWNKALLDNAARPSGALVYSAAAGNLTPDQFERLKGELEQGFAGAANAGRPMLLEGGLDWKALGLSPRDMDFIELKNVAAREIALAFGVPPMLLGIPGDNTYANLAEANRALWRQTVIPLVRRVADDLSAWLAPVFGGVALVPDLENVEALAEDRAALWARVGSAEFLSDAEKRAMLGVASSQ